MARQRSRNFCGRFRQQMTEQTKKFHVRLRSDDKGWNRLFGKALRHARVRCAVANVDEARLLSEQWLFIECSAD